MESDSVRKVAFLIMGCDVHILEQRSHLNNHIVIRAACTVLSASLSHTSSVIITTRDNKIWLLSASQLMRNDTRKANCEVERSEEHMDAGDIFKDILDSKAQSEKIHLEDNDLKNELVPQNIYSFVLRPHHLLYSVDGTVIDVEAVDDLLCVLVNISGIAEIHIFRISADQQSEDRAVLSLLETFTTGIESTSFCKYSVKKTKCLYSVMSRRENYTDTISAPSSSGLFVVPQTLLNIPIQLFTILFGKEAACLNSQILMLCTDNGCVYSFVIKSMKSLVKKAQRLICQLDSDIVGILPVEITQSVMNDDASNVSDIVSTLTLSLKEEQTTKMTSHTSTCLVVFSATGKGSLFVPPTPENDCPSTLMFCVPHQMKLCIAYGESVLYSTGNSVEACEFKLIHDKKVNVSSVTPVLRTLMRKARILRLLPFAPLSGPEDMMISAVTSSFDFVPISTHLKEAGPESIAEGTHSLKDILHSIEKCSVTYKSLKKDSLNIDSILLQVNIFASLAQIKALELSAETKTYHPTATELRDPIIACICKVLSSQNIYTCDRSLRIVLQNLSAVSLSEDWIVLVTLHGKKEGISSFECERFNQSFSIPLSSGLKCKSSITLNLPLDRIIKIHPIPSVDVRVSLVLSFQDASSKGRNIPETLLYKSLKLEIYRKKIDILHFFHKFMEESGNQEIRNEHSSYTSVISRDDHWLFDELNKFSHIQVTGKRKDCPAQVKSQIFNIMVGISEHECKEHQLSNTTEVFAFLLKDSSIMVDNTLGSHIQLEDPHGHLTMLVVSASAAGNESTDKSPVEIYPIILTLKGNDAGLLLQVRSAIKSRLKVNISEVSGLQPRSCGDLRKQLMFLQGVQKDLQHMRRRLVSHKEDEDESLKLVCEMVDRSEFLTNNT